MKAVRLVTTKHTQSQLASLGSSLSMAVTPQASLQSTPNSPAESRDYFWKDLEFDPISLPSNISFIIEANQGHCTSKIGP